MRKLTKEARNEELKALHGRLEDAIEHTLRGITDEEIRRVFEDTMSKEIKKEEDK